MRVLLFFAALHTWYMHVKFSSSSRRMEGDTPASGCGDRAPPLPLPLQGAQMPQQQLQHSAPERGREDGPQLLLVAAEGDVIAVPRYLAMQSGFLRSMIDDPDEEGGVDDGVAAHMEDIPLPSICNKALRSVVDFWYHFHEDPLPPIEKPLRSGNIFEIVPEWYAEFITSAGGSHDDLYDVIMAANFLDVRALLDLGCAFIASQIRDKSMEQVCETFGVANRMTRADEMALRQDPRNAWVFQDLDV